MKPLLKKTKIKIAYSLIIGCRFPSNLLKYLINILIEPLIPDLLLGVLRNNRLQNYVIINLTVVLDGLVVVHVRLVHQFLSEGGQFGDLGQVVLRGGRLFALKGQIVLVVREIFFIFFIIVICLFLKVIFIYKFFN
jgi:hypothetical protein